MTSSQNPNATAQLQKPILKEGSSGDAVKELQKLLLRYGIFVYLNQEGACVFAGEEAIDGIFGAKTAIAVKNFQSLMFLPIDGIVGDKTWRSLFKGAPVDMPILKRSSEGELVRLVQERLALGNIYQGKIDGEFGRKMEVAVKALQKGADLPVNGEIDDRTWFEISKISNIFC